MCVHRPGSLQPEPEVPHGTRPQATSDVQDYQVTPESQLRPSAEPHPHSLVSHRGEDKSSLPGASGLSPSPPIASDASLPALPLPPPRPPLVTAVTPRYAVQPSLSTRCASSSVTHRPQGPSPHYLSDCPVLCPSKTPLWGSRTVESGQGAAQDLYPGHETRASFRQGHTSGHREVRAHK